MRQREFATLYLVQKISFGGKEYVRASEIAKKFRYTQDYVGQLCRSKKVDARLVGRNWYVVPESVIEYRKTKHKTQKLAAKKPAPPVSVVERRKKPAKQVEPVARAKTIKFTRGYAAGSVSQVPVTYSPDDSVLVPVLEVTTEQVSQRKPTAVVKIEAQPATTVPVTSNKPKETKFSSDKLPEISLSGKLKVTEGAHEEVAQEPPEPPETKMEDVTLSKQKTQQNAAVATEKTPIATDKPAELTFSDRLKQKQAKTDLKIPSFTPETVVKKQKKSARSWDLVILLAAVALVLSILILSAGSEVVVSDDGDQNGFNFDLRNVHQVAEIF